MRHAIALAPSLLLAAACSSPPKPPTVDEATRRPVNSTQAVELQVCQNDLHNTRILATESGRLADATAATLQQQAARQQLLASLQPTAPSAATAPPAAPAATTPQPTPAQSAPLLAANTLFTVHFAFGSSQLTLPPHEGAALLAQARQAPLVLLRGRTDGDTDAPAESRIARDRANAVRDHLVAHGVNPARIRTTYQPAGDHVADNTSDSGRGLNRRVEIELYRALPLALGTPPASQP